MTAAAAAAATAITVARMLAIVDYLSRLVEIRNSKSFLLRAVHERDPLYAHKQRAYCPLLSAADSWTIMHILQTSSVELCQF